MSWRVHNGYILGHNKDNSNTVFFGVFYVGQELKILSFCCVLKYIHYIYKHKLL